MFSVLILADSGIMVQRVNTSFFQQRLGAGQGEREILPGVIILRVQEFQPSVSVQLEGSQVTVLASLSILPIQPFLVIG